MAQYEPPALKLRLAFEMAFELWLSGDAWLD
jgi:hypothetical protein